MWRCQERHGEARLGNARQGYFFNKRRSKRIFRGAARLGLVRGGQAGFGKARQCKARLMKGGIKEFSWQGVVLFGGVRDGKVGFGNVM